MGKIKVKHWAAPNGVAKHRTLTSVMCNDVNLFASLKLKAHSRTISSASFLVSQKPLFVN